MPCVLAAVAGGPGGLIWAAVAPRALVTLTGHGAANVINPETPAFVAADGWFCVIGLAGGVLCGLAGYFAAVRRRAAPGAAALTAAALIIGAVGASLIAWQIGSNIGLPGLHAELMAGHAGAVMHAPLTLRARSALVSWPFGAALALLAAELVTGQRRGPQPVGAAGTQWAEARPG